MHSNVKDLEMTVNRRTAYTIGVSWLEVLKVFPSVCIYLEGGDVIVFLYLLDSNANLCTSTTKGDFGCMNLECCQYGQRQ